MLPIQFVIPRKIILGIAVAFHGSIYSPSHSLALLARSFATYLHVVQQRIDTNRENKQNEENEGVQFQKKKKSEKQNKELF